MTNQEAYEKLLGKRPTIVRVICSLLDEYDTPEDLTNRITNHDDPPELRDTIYQAAEYIMQSHTLAEIDNQKSLVGCEDCGKPYDTFGFDTHLPSHQWKAIIRRNSGSGILCANCIIKRGETTFSKATIVKMRFAE